MSSSTHVVPCTRCGGYKVTERVWWGRRGRSKVALLIAVLVVTMVTAFRLRRCNSRYQHSRQKAPYDRWLPLILVGGVPRSGSSLMRALLDAHPKVRCGPDTRVIPRVLQMYHHWISSYKEHTRLLEAGVDDQVLQSAVAAMLLELIAGHGEAAPRLCNKDSLTMHFATLLSRLFPNAKFLWVVRDARATVHSIISRQIRVSGYDLDSYPASLEQWNNSTGRMLEQCRQLGAGRCHVVRYEQLVLKPRPVLGEVLRFLELPWAESVLHHETLVGKPGGVHLSRFELSSPEVRRAIHQDSLLRWVGRVSDEDLKEAPELAPLNSALGYSQDTPNYLGMTSLSVDVHNIVLPEGYPPVLAAVGGGESTRGGPRGGTPAGSRQLRP